MKDGWEFQITAHHDGEKDVERKRYLANNNRIIFTVNDKRLGIFNGTMGQIEAIKGYALTVRTGREEQVVFDVK